MADIHFHIWLYKRDTDGIIRSMERAEEQFDIRRKANYGLEVFRRQRSLEVWPETRFSPSRRFLNVDWRCNSGFLKRIAYTTMPYKTGLRLLGVARNPANGFPARLLAGQVVQCVDGAFCKPPPDWVVKGYTLAGPQGVQSGILHRRHAVHPAVAEVVSRYGKPGEICERAP